MRHYKAIKQMQAYGARSAGKIPHNYVKVGEEQFDSQAEADRYMELLVLQKAGVIAGLRCHPHYDLIPAQKVPGQRGFRAHGYTADFAYIRDGEEIIEDVKSVRTREERDYIINRKLMWMLKGLYVHEVVR